MKSLAPLVLLTGLWVATTAAAQDAKEPLKPEEILARIKELGGKYELDEKHPKKPVPKPKPKTRAKQRVAGKSRSSAKPAARRNGRAPKKKH